MSFDTYSTLTDAVKRWIKRSDLDAYIPEFISIAESKLARKLRLWGMEKSVDYPLTSGAFAVPADLLEPTRLTTVVGGQVRSIIYVSATQFTRTQNWTDSPANYTILSGNIVVSPVPADGTVVTLTYFAKPASLSSSNQTNLFTQVAADALLAAALVEAFSLIRNDSMVALWSQKRDEALADVQDTDERAQASGPFRIRTDNFNR